MITGGGTGGHIYPGLAVAAALEKRQPCAVLFAGTRRGLESRVVPGAGYPMGFVWISGLHRGRILGNMLFPLKMAVSFIQAAALVIQHRPLAVLGTGGYVSWPVLAAARFMGRPYYLQEQNLAPGLVTRMMARGAETVFTSYEETALHLPNGTVTAVSGNPTRGDLASIPRRPAAEALGLDPGLRTLLVFGGSQGSKFLNSCMEEAGPGLAEKQGIQILWSAGPAWAEDLRSRISNHRITIVPYLENMAAAYGAADLVVCRAGATTVAEITRVGLPAVLVPFARSAAGHQQQNARELEEAGAAKMVTEEQAARGGLEQAVSSMLEDSGRLAAMAAAAASLGRPGAADFIAERILEWGNENEKT